MAMEFVVEIAKVTRQKFITLMDTLSIEQLNVIPPGYSNNIAWNFAHIVAAQQILCYVRANMPPRILIEEITKYQNGTRPQGFISQSELSYYKEKAFSLLDDLQEDVAVGIFENYQPVNTAFGITLNNINEAIVYFSTHDNLHFGYAIALKKAVLQHEEERTISELTINNL
jgi:hypothetical protein